MNIIKKQFKPKVYLFHHYLVKKVQIRYVVGYFLDFSITKI